MKPVRDGQYAINTNFTNMHFWSYYVNWKNRLVYDCGTYKVHVSSLQELYKITKTKYLHHANENEARHTTYKIKFDGRDLYQH